MKQPSVEEQSDQGYYVAAIIHASNVAYAAIQNAGMWELYSSEKKLNYRLQAKWEEAARVTAELAAERNRLKWAASQAIDVLSKTDPFPESRAGQALSALEEALGTPPIK